MTAILWRRQITAPGLQPHGRQADAKLGAHCDLGRGGVPQPVQVSHLQLGVRQRDCLVKQLTRALQISTLDLNCAECFVCKLALLINLQRLGDELHCLGDVALGLESHETPVDQEVSVAGVHLHAGLVEVISLVKLLGIHFVENCLLDRLSPNLLVTHDLGVESI